MAQDCRACRGSALSQAASKLARIGDKPLTAAAIRERNRERAAAWCRHLPNCRSRCGCYGNVVITVAYHYVAVAAARHNFQRRDPLSRPSATGMAASEFAQCRNRAHNGPSVPRGPKGGYQATTAVRAAMFVGKSSAFAGQLANQSSRVDARRNAQLIYKARLILGQHAATGP
jgi:hypothetical protein